MIGNPEDIIRYCTYLDKDKQYELKEHKKKRSLNANAYYWVLINKIASTLNQSKEFIHLCMLKQYGETYSLLLPEEQSINGLIKYYEKESTIQKNNKKYNHYKAYLPSSEMNTKQMSVLIDGVVAEAKDIGIETLTPDELTELKQNWGL